VYGVASATTGINVGVQGVTNSTDGYGVYGVATATGLTITYGGYFESLATGGRGVFGAGPGYGVLGEGGGFPFPFAVYAVGNLGASGSKPFRIDHPDDPGNKYLLHYAAESPEVINFYSGKATLDAAGQVAIDLPLYFARINRDPRYTLTAMGAPMPMLHIAEEIDESALTAGAASEPGEGVPVCSFRIAGGTPGGKVSWEVKALRNDRWVQRHGAPVEMDKPALEKGTYQHPDLYGQPPEKGMSYRPRYEPLAATNAQGGQP
jgi:hypothetical protein